MKCLKISNGKGEYSLDGVSYKSIDEIKKDDIIALVDITLNPDEEIEMDTYSAETLTNPAHRVIYNNLYDKFTELKSNKDQFITEVDELYQEAYEKYRLQDTEISLDS